MTLQQEAIRDASAALLQLLDETVPEATIHWAVEQARAAAWNLRSYANTVKTRDADDESS